MIEIMGAMCGVYWPVVSFFLSRPHFLPLNFVL